MRKTFIIASREYLAAVKTKSFLVSLIMLPIMMSGGLVAQKLQERFADTSTRRIAIIDRTPDGAIYSAISQAVEQHNAAVANASATPPKAKFQIERAPTTQPGDETSLDPLRLSLSDRVRKGELLAFVEIDPDVYAPSTQPASSEGDSAVGPIHYSTNRPTYHDFQDLMKGAVVPAVVERRLAEVGIPYYPIKPRLTEPTIDMRGLAESHEGQITFERREKQMASVLVPVLLLVLMFMVVFIGASPMTGNVIEEKTLRIAEVLLGSVRPAELMAGKLLGGVAVALTLAAIYFGGAYYVAFTQGFAGFISAGTICWFLFFTVLGTLMYGSMFLAAGAAVTNLKEAQTMMMPVMLLIVLPVSVAASSLIQDPHGTVAQAASFFPFSAPMIMTARLSIPPGVPLWQTFLSALVSLTTTLILVWVAGRVFRVGILMHGQGANFADLARWIVRG